MMKLLFPIGILMLFLGSCPSCHNASAVSEDSDETLPTDDGWDDDTDSGGSIAGDSENDTATETPVLTPRSGKLKALVSIVDNSQALMNDSIETLYAQYPDELSAALADLYQQPISEIQGRTLSEIAEDFGEDWIIDSIENVADGNYDMYLSLTDDDATLQHFVETMQSASDQGYVVDALIDLHGSSSGEIVFHDGSYAIADITDYIQSLNINLSVVYQTVCYGSNMIDTWANMGVHAVNGSEGDNLYVNFAPGAFLDYWISGSPYDEAVQQARIDDMTEMQDRLSAAAADNVELTLMLSFYNFTTLSEQLVAGKYPQINW